MKNFEEKLAEHRRSVDKLDAILVYTLGERFKQTEKIGILKAEAKIQATDHERELVQVERLRKLSEDANLDADFAEKLLKFIISEVVKNHDKIKSR
ncbi:MAG: chorismate mutase [Rhodobacteraceae bacterium]|nr:MAG: chorismate mutase [Paracoccaceae bacterium]|tara:strand:- start:527 stop:814 length:288 start_codon:yes stop_codon:yes gene_type:complete